MKKGQVSQMIGVVILLIVIGVIFLGFFAWGIVAPVFTSMSGEVTNLFSEIGEESSGTQGNVSQAIESSFVQGNKVVQSLEWITYIVFFSMIIGFLVLAFSVRTYPFLLGFWILGVIVLTFLSLFITVSYQEILAGDDYLRGIYESWEFQHFILSHFPHLIVTVGTIGAIILFMVITKSDETEVTGL